MSKSKSKLPLTNPINISGSNFEYLVECSINKQCLKTTSVKTYAKKDITTHIVYDSTMNCTKNEPSYFWGTQQVHPDFTLWNPDTKQTFYIEIKTQNVGGSVQDKLYAAIGRDFLNGPSLNTVYFYIYQMPGVSKDYLNRLEADYSKVAAITNKKFKVFTSLSDFEVFIAKAPNTWKI